MTKSSFWIIASRFTGPVVVIGDTCQFGPVPKNPDARKSVDPVYRSHFGDRVGTIFTNEGAVNFAVDIVRRLFMA
jgi:hypothetical protein